MPANGIIAFSVYLGRDRLGPKVEEFPFTARPPVIEAVPGSNYCVVVRNMHFKLVYVKCLIDGNHITGGMYSLHPNQEHVFDCFKKTDPFTEDCIQYPLTFQTLADLEQPMLLGGDNESSRVGTIQIEVFESTDCVGCPGYHPTVRHDFTRTRHASTQKKKTLGALCTTPGEGQVERRSCRGNRTCRGHRPTHTKLCTLDLSYASSTMRMLMTLQEERQAGAVAGATNANNNNTGRNRSTSYVAPSPAQTSLETTSVIALAPGGVAQAPKLERSRSSVGEGGNSRQSDMPLENGSSKKRTSEVEIISLEDPPAPVKRAHVKAEKAKGIAATQGEFLCDLTSGSAVWQPTAG